MNQVVSPVNIVASALIMQFSLVAVGFIAVIILQTGGPPATVLRRTPSSSGMHLMTLTLALVTIGLLVFSDEYSVTWKPLFGAASKGGVPWSWALVSVFILDILWVTALVIATGGSMTSPFGSVYFIIPPLAIFLRESLDHVILYLSMVTVCFSINFAVGNERGRSRGGTRRPFAYWFVAVACFALATIIGYITRPH